MPLTRNIALTNDQLYSRVQAGVFAARLFKENPSKTTIEYLSRSLQDLGLPAIDATTTPTYDPWADPRLGATIALDTLVFAARAVSDDDLARMEAGVEAEASQEERWAEVIGVLATIAVRIGAAFAKL